MMMEYPDHSRTQGQARQAARHGGQVPDRDGVPPRGEQAHQRRHSLARAGAPVRAILERALEGREISRSQGTILFAAPDADLEAICGVADTLRRRAVGDTVSFVVNRNINFTNICYMGCRFCNFARRAEQAGANWLSLPEIVARACEAVKRGASEVCLQGGLHPHLPAGYYRDIVRALRDALPDLHIHAFSPFEIWFGAAKAGMSHAAYLADLKSAGLDSMPGTAAEILDTKIRRQLTRNKLSARQWVEIVRTAHGAGIPTSATIMYGHIEGPAHQAAHIALLRAIQKRTGGFTELVPLSFVHANSPLYLENPGQVRAGPGWPEVMKMHAVSRIMLHGWIDNIQVSWPKLGPRRALQLLQCGANDVGGSLMNESISRAAGATNGQEITSREFVQMIRAASRRPARRTTLYRIVERFDAHDPPDTPPLVARNAGAGPQFAPRLAATSQA